MSAGCWPAWWISTSRSRSRSTPKASAPWPRSFWTRSTDGEKKVPQYLVLFSENKDGMPFDFNQIRVFTWNVKRHRYETAYREHGLNGVLPVTVSHETFDKEGDLPVFVVRVKDDAGNVSERKYKLNTPIVRRVLAPGEQKEAASRGRRPPPVVSQEKATLAAIRKAVNCAKPGEPIRIPSCACRCGPSPSDSPFASSCCGCCWPALPAEAQSPNATVQPLLRSGQAALDAGDYARAARDFERARQIAPTISKPTADCC